MRRETMFTAYMDAWDAYMMGGVTEEGLRWELQQIADRFALTEEAFRNAIRQFASELSQ